MKILLLLVLLYCSQIFVGSAYAFPWSQFIPVITNMGEINRCMQGDIPSCRTEDLCNSTGNYWYVGRCHKDKHPNQLKIEKLAGAWMFKYKYYWDRVDYYYFDINKVSKYPNEDVYYMIEGVDENGLRVSAGYAEYPILYYPFLHRYVLLDSNGIIPYSGPIEDYQPEGILKDFLFDFVNNNEFSGAFRDILNMQNSDDWVNIYSQLNGYRIQ